MSGKAKKQTGPKTARNPELIHGVNTFGRSASRARARKYLYTKKKTPAKVQGPKQAEQKREGRFYQADDAPRKLASRKNHHKPTRLRASITPGTVLILLAGRFRGKRVVFLKQLPSGLLLVTGPYKVNGVPLRRVNQAYTIATSTKVDVKGVDVAAISDDFFKRATEKASDKSAGEFFKEDSKKTAISEARKAAQKKVDSVLVGVIAKTELLKHYLGAKFSLTNGQQPHKIQF